MARLLGACEHEASRVHEALLCAEPVTCVAQLQRVVACVERQLLELERVDPVEGSITQLGDQSVDVVAVGRGCPPAAGTSRPVRRTQASVRPSRRGSDRSVRGPGGSPRTPPRPPAARPLPRDSHRTPDTESVRVDDRTAATHVEHFPDHTNSTSMRRPRPTSASGSPSRRLVSRVGAAGRVICGVHDTRRSGNTRTPDWHLWGRGGVAVPNVGPAGSVSAISAIDVVSYRHFGAALTRLLDREGATGRVPSSA